MVSHMRRPSRLLSAVLAGGLAATAFAFWARSSGAQVPTPDATVTLKDSKFNPATVKFDKAGATVKWTHQDGQTPHTITFDAPKGSIGYFDSNEACQSDGQGGAKDPKECMQQGDSDVYVTFVSGGTFKYHCKIHGAMTGVVEVAGAGAQQPTTTSTTVAGATTSTTKGATTETTVGTLTTETTSASSTTSSSTSTTLGLATATTTGTAAPSNESSDEPSGVLQAVGVLLLAAVVAALIPAWRRLT